MISEQSRPRIFTVWSDELEGILSPPFFISKPINKKGFVELKEVATVNPTRKKPVFGDDAMVAYVGLPETDDQQIREIWMRPYKQVRGRNIIRKGDILFARIEPSVFNRKYIFADDLKENDFAFTSTEFYIVEPKENINPHFLFHMFFVRPVYDQVIGKTTGSTGRRRLDKGVFEKILIPFPTRVVQDKIVAYLQKAYVEKRKKEEETKKILASIDGYVLGELGIEIPRWGAERIFEIWSDEIENRLDPFFYQSYFREFGKQLESSKYKLAKLGDVCAAVRGVTYSSEDEAEVGVKILRANNITLATNEINLDDVRNIRADFPVSEEQRLRAGDILMSAASGSKEHVGKVAYIADDTDFYFGSFMMVLRADTKAINPQYLFEFLSSKIFRGLLSRILGGTNINNLNFSMIEGFEIPLPPSSTQTKIAKTAQKNRTKARELEEGAKKIIATIDNFVLGKLGIDTEGEHERESKCARKRRAS